MSDKVILRDKLTNKMDQGAKTVSEDIPWTENEEIEAYQAGNTMLDIIGYIDSVEGLRSVKTHQKWLFKIILCNNKGSKVRINFWRDKAVEYSTKLRLHQIVEITGCTVSDVKFQFDRDLKGVIAPQELHFQEFSTVNVLSSFDITNVATVNTTQYLKVSIDKCMEHLKETIAVPGYVKNEFAVFKTIGEMPLANGNIADGRFRLCVQIHGYRYLSTSPLKRGVYATYQGKMDTSKSGAPFLRVDGISNIIIDENTPEMPLDKLRLAIYPPPTPRPDDLPTQKRLADHDKENTDDQDGKKMKTD